MARARGQKLKVCQCILPSWWPGHIMITPALLRPTHRRRHLTSQLLELWNRRPRPPDLASEQIVTLKGERPALLLTHHGQPAVHAGLTLHRRDLGSSVRPSSSWPLSSPRTTRPSVNYPAFNSDNAISTDFHPELHVLACARVLVLVCLCSRACARVPVLVVLVLSCACA